MKLFRAWAPVAIWMVIIFAFSSRPSTSVSDEFTVNFIFFKSLHVLEYAMLYILSYRATKHKLWAFIITIGYAATDELHQTFVPTREGRVRDVIIDAVGATLAWITLVKLLPKTPKKLRKLAGKLLSI